MGPTRGLILQLDDDRLTLVFAKIDLNLLPLRFLDVLAELSKDIEETKWQQVQIDLSKYEGKTIVIELQNQATGWAHEAAYWSRIQIVH